MSGSDERQPLDWLWKPIAAIMIPVAVAAAPALFAWMSNDRGVDNVIVKSAFDILKTDPQGAGESGTRDWAIRVVERYSGVRFNESARKELQTGPLPISQSAVNPNPASPEEIAKAKASANAVNNTKLLNIALSQLGVAETPGKANTPAIMEFNASMGLDDDENTPWNSQFLNWVVVKAGYKGTNNARSRSWLTWGKSAEDETGESLIPGCVAVLWRVNPDHWGGVVGLYVGDDESGKMRILAGNLFNRVDVATFEPERLLSCRLAPDWKGPAQ